ncbi:MAG: ABC transporter ATP-binding protein [Hyphomicrobiaceae bacterium]|nr:ABC transporter ATP-binding protein [Hyphomicrobiaceae bacterium]MCC0010807.1 ABC transporter ATP-binding protein [Hyphomicrobiaceae bacterium]
MLIEAENLTKSFGTTQAVKGISFKVNAGERVGVLGVNGAGKSTTLRMLAGTIAPNQGRALIAGSDIQTAPLQARRAIGYLPEAANGFSELRVAEFLAFGAEARGLKGARRNNAVRNVIDMLNLGDAAAKHLSVLSKGWRQRAWLAHALIHDPPVLILDEPTDGLDPIQKIALRRLLADISRDKAMLISTHILEEAEALCDRILVIDSGRIIADAPTAELADEHGRIAPAFLRLTGAGESTSQVKENA